MNKSLVTLIILAFFLFAAGIYAGWREDLKRGGIDTAGNKVTTTNPLKVGKSGASITQIDCGSVTFTDAATTVATYTLTGLTSVDFLQVHASGAYSGSVYIKSVVKSNNRWVITWSGDPGTTVPLDYLWIKKH